MVGGAFAKLLLRALGVSITAWTRQVGNLVLEKDYHCLDFSEIERNPVRCADAETAEKMAQLIMEVKEEGDTIGGVIECVVQGVPAGWGEPVFGKLQARLAAAMLSINAAKGFEYGLGFAGSSWRGSVQNDAFLPGFTTATNHSGGIQGGISNGQDIVFRVAFKPVATILQPQTTIDVKGHAATLDARGRHDACVLPRAVPIVESMAALVLADAYLAQRISRFE